MSTTPPVKLDTFSYEALAPDEADRTSSDLERGRSGMKDVEGTRRLEERDEGEEEEVEDDLAWQEPHRKKRKRSRWIPQIGLFAVGAIAGAGLLSAGRWTFQSTTSSSSPIDYGEKPSPIEANLDSTADAEFDFSNTPPVRIHYREENDLNARPPILPPRCPVPVVYSTDEDSADIVVFNSDSHLGLEEDELRERKIQRPWQRTAIWGVESAPNRDVLEQHFDKLRQGKRNETYDYEMTYRLNSTVPATYSYGYFNYSNPPVPRSSKRLDRIAASFISNCRPKNARTRILDELTRLLPGKIDNFGKCHNNADADDALKEIGHYDDVGSNHNKWNTKITTINYYLFSIAFENSNDYDYVTEKYFQALERGSVPIVFGAPSYSSRFFPAPNAAIDVSDYLPSNYTQLSRSDDTQPDELSPEAIEGIERLAKRLEYLSSEEGKEEYEAMLEWKRDGRWLEDRSNPLNKIVRMSKSEWDQDCRLAGRFRNEEWAKSGFEDP